MSFPIIYFITIAFLTFFKYEKLQKKIFFYYYYVCNNFNNYNSNYNKKIK